MRHFQRRWYLTGLFILGCGDSAGPDQRSISISPTEVLPQPCADGACRTLITIEARDSDSDELLSTRLRIDGDGNHPVALRTSAAGVVTFSWSYPAVAGRYDLAVCPIEDPEGGCARFLDIVQEVEDTTS